jgi:hypothetical protein
MLNPYQGELFMFEHASGKAIYVGPRISGSYLC